MRSVGAFLRGKAPPGPVVWRLEFRPAEGGTWREVQRAGDPALLRDELLAPGFDWSAGDLVRLVGPGEVTDGVWVGATGGLLDAGGVPVDLWADVGPMDWVTAWEGPKVEADALLRCTDPVEPWRVVLAACDCVAVTLPLLPPRNERAARAIEAARVWALGVAAGADPAAGVEGVARAGRSAARAALRKNVAFHASSADAAVVSGSDFFRLNTLLTSPGDIYESAQGSHAFAVGPDSDIAAINVYYLDADAPGAMNSFQVSPDRAFVGTVPALTEQNYATPTPIPGRVLISPSDIYNPTWRPTGFDSADDVINFVTPVLDVIQYFTEQPGLVSQRVDRSYEFDAVSPRGSGSPTGVGWIVLPAYGRKSGSFRFGNGFTPADLEVTLYGVKLGISQSVNGVPADLQQELMAMTTIATGGSAVYAFKSSAVGMFDYFAIKYHAKLVTGPNYGAFTFITLSDDAL